MKNGKTANLKTLQQDNVFVKSEVKSLEKLTGLKTRKGLESAILSEGEIVNVVSKGYGHLPNEKFFAEVEVQLIKAGIGYVTRSINRDNRSFSVDYILQDESLAVKVKQSNLDKIRPMLSFTSSYDSSCKTSGHFGFFREICKNGLHVAHGNIGFSVKHRGNICEIVLPEITSIVAKFIDNEYYSLHKKFEVLAEKPLKDIEGFVQVTAEQFKLFKFESSEKNPAPSLNARMVMDVISRESAQFKTKPTLWHGYNAFNEILHEKLKKSFDAQRLLDAKIFEHALAY